MRGRMPGLAALLLAWAAPAAAQGAARELCTDRPGLGTPPCIVERGRLVAELGVADWTLDRQAGARDDEIAFGDLLLRYGVSDDMELIAGWDAIAHLRSRDRAGGAVAKATRAGDATLGLKRSFAHPGGDGFSIAAQPFVTLPIGRAPAGAGTWGAGLLLPVSYDLNDTVQLQLTPEIDALPDADRHGRHLACAATAGVSVQLGQAFDVVGEVQAMRDRDPGGHATIARAGLAGDWKASADTQLDIGSAFGLDRDAADLELYAGISHRF